MADPVGGGAATQGSLALNELVAGMARGVRPGVSQIATVAGPGELPPQTMSPDPSGAAAWGDALAALNAKEAAERQANGGFTLNELSVIRSALPARLERMTGGFGHQVSPEEQQMMLDSLMRFNQLSPYQPGARDQDSSAYQQWVRESNSGAAGGRGVSDFWLNNHSREMRDLQSWALDVLEQHRGGAR